MVRTTFFILLITASLSYANDCRVVIHGFETKDTMYVLCKDLSGIDEKEAKELVIEIMGQYKGPPDEIIVYFIGSIEDLGKVNYNSKNLVGFYYTHSNELIIWPGQEGKKKVFIKIR
ncbi:MAG: hypothetical protein GY714_00285 [Desulfobacterales bacterium]|nr:hypothetical protein [Desulfobacterales bacterium]